MHVYLIACKQTTDFELKCKFYIVIYEDILLFANKWFISNKIISIR